MFFAKCLKCYKLADNNVTVSTIYNGNCSDLE